MTKAQQFDLACNTCEVIGPTLVIGATVQIKAARGRPTARAAEGRQAWTAFFAGHTITDVPAYDEDGERSLTEFTVRGHAGHDLRLLAHPYDPVIPLAGWMPRPDHGPAAGNVEAGHREQQLVACPDCRAVYLHGDKTRRAVAFLTADGGTKWFLFCRHCRNVWGEAAVERIVRAELTRGEPDLWALQRQGIQDEGTAR